MNWKILWGDMCYVAGSYPLQMMILLIVGAVIGSLATALLG